MAIQRIEIGNYAEVSGIVAGDQVFLGSGKYKKPLVIDGKSGTAQSPIFIERCPAATPGSVVFQSEISTAAARKWANGVADRRQRAGYYPIVGHLGDQSMLILRNCQFVVVRGLNFHDCWPGGIYLDNCQNIVIDDVQFRGGTIAIGANGIFTHDLFIQHCHWQQDTTGTVMWDKVPWGRIHGASNNSEEPGVDLIRDYRHWDGDFFRGWNVGGNIVIRNNTIKDAFNAIHFFNSIDKLAPGVDADMLTFNNGRRSTANVLIENNDFVRVRDNVFEPEDHAWNWVIRYNRLVDCYRPFSFEFERAGYFYIYGNTGSFANSPSTELSPLDKKKYKDELRHSVSLFKPKGKQDNEGSIYVFFNSWFFAHKVVDGKVKAKAKGILPKFGLGKLVHLNNAIQYEKPKKGRMFGNDGGMEFDLPLSVEKELKSERRRFTRRWKNYQIEMNGDVANDVSFPDEYRALGYNIGTAAEQANPRFCKPVGTLSSPADFTSKAKKVIGTSISFTLEFPDGYLEVVPKGYNRGAVQTKKVFARVDGCLRFLPDDSWLPDNPDRRLFIDPGVA